MATRRGPAVYKMAVLFACLSTALALGQRNGRVSGRDDVISRDQLLSTKRKELQERESVGHFKDIIHHLTTNRRRSDDKAREILDRKSRGPDSRRAALNDDDPLTMFLRNQRPHFIRGFEDSKTRTNPAKKNTLLSTENKKSGVTREVKRNHVAGPPRGQRLLQDLHRQTRQDFMFAIGAAQAPSSSGSSGDLFNSQFGSQAQDRPTYKDSTDEVEYEYYWVECEENDPECEDQRALNKKK